MIVVHVPNQFLSRAVQEHQFSLGKKWGSTMGRKSFNFNIAAVLTYGENACIRIDDDEQLTYGNLDYFRKQGFTILSVDEYFKKDFNVFDDRIIIGNNKYHVTDINEEGFNIGCNHITWETIDKILKLKPRSY